MLDPAGRSGPENMAIDAELLAEASRTGRAFLRLYRFDPPCLSFGRHEPARDRYDRAAIARLGIDVVRRPTGGRAVWHEHEVTYAVAAPMDAFGGLRESYRAIHRRIAAALRALGADAVLAPDRPRPPSTALDRPSCCFAAPVGGEVLVRSRKPQAASRKCRNHAFGRTGTARDVGESCRGNRADVGRRGDLYRPLPPSTALCRRLFRPCLDLAPLGSPWNLRRHADHPTACPPARRRRPREPGFPRRGRASRRLFGRLLRHPRHRLGRRAGHPAPAREPG